MGSAIAHEVPHLTSILLDYSLRVKSFEKEQVKLCIILFLTLFIGGLSDPREKLPVTKINYLRALRIRKSVTKMSSRISMFGYVKSKISFFCLVAQVFNSIQGRL